MTPDFCSPILYKIRQGASDSATLLVVISDATQNTDKKTSKIVYFILAEALIFRCNKPLLLSIYQVLASGDDGTGFFLYHRNFV